MDSVLLITISAFILAVILIIVTIVIIKGNQNKKYKKEIEELDIRKNNLIFKDQNISYQLVDKTGLLDGIYTFMSNDYGVDNSDKVWLKITGHVVDKTTFEVTKIVNYQIPKEKL